MSYKKFRWSKDYEAAEEELESFLAHLEQPIKRWELAADASVTSINYPSGRTLWCAEGSLRLTLEKQTITVQPGDTIVIEPNTAHSITAGVAGCVCYEADPVAS